MRSGATYSALLHLAVVLMAMFGLPHATVLALLRETDARVLAIEPDQSHGPEPPGYEYWLTR